MKAATYKLVVVREELYAEGGLPAADGRGRRAAIGVDEPLGAPAQLVLALDGAGAAHEGAGYHHAIIPHRQGSFCRFHDP